MSYRLTFFKGFDAATESFSDEEINQVFDALTEMAHEENLQSGEVKVGRNLWVALEVTADTLHVAGVSRRSAKPTKNEPKDSGA